MSRGESAGRREISSSAGNNPAEISTSMYLCPTAPWDRYTFGSWALEKQQPPAVFTASSINKTQLKCLQQPLSVCIPPPTGCEQSQSFIWDLTSAGSGHGGELSTTSSSAGKFPRWRRSSGKRMQQQEISQHRGTQLTR